MGLNFLSALLLATSPQAASTATHHEIGWWEGAGGAIVGGLLGALIGSYVPILTARWARAVERRGELRAMWAELYHAFRAMKTLRSQTIAAPHYRLPLTMFKLALPKLIGEGLLTNNQVSGLVEYVWRVEELNSGLDSSAAAAAAGREALMYAEFERNKAKAQEILETKESRLDDQTVYDTAWGALLDAEDATMLGRIELIWARVRRRAATQRTPPA